MIDILSVTLVRQRASDVCLFEVAQNTQFLGESSAASMDTGRCSARSASSVAAYTVSCSMLTRINVTNTHIITSRGGPIGERSLLSSTTETLLIHLSTLRFRREIDPNFHAIYNLKRGVIRQTCCVQTLQTLNIFPSTAKAFAERLHKAGST
jgi:hypothetical protein